MFAVLCAMLMMDGDRALSVREMSKNDRERCLKVMSFTLNSLSRSQYVINPKLEGDYIKFNLDDYKLDAKVYDSLPWPKGEKRAEWFIKEVWSHKYFQMLSIKSLDDYKKLVFMDEKMAVPLQQKAIVTAGKVALKDQILIRTPTITGYVWEARSSRGIRPLMEEEKPDCRMFIGSLPNGLHAYCMTDDKDKLCSEGDPKLMMDAQGLMRTGYSCVVCHTQGIEPIKDIIRGSLTIKSTTGKDLKAFTSDLSVEEDQNRYKKVLKKVNGLTPRENAGMLHFVIKDYNAPVDLNKAARYMNVTEQEMKKACNRSQNPNLLRLGLGYSIRRDVWDELESEIRDVEK